MIRKSIAQALVAAAVTAIALPAAAATEYVSIDAFSPGKLDFFFTFDDGTTTSTSSSAGRFAGTLGLSSSGTNPSFETYCVSLRQSIPGWGVKFAVNRVAFSANPYASATHVQTLLNKLTWKMANDGGYAVTDATTSAAMQLAVWEIVYDDGADVKAGGGFHLDGTLSGARLAAANQANAWLAGLASSNHQYIAERLYNPIYQDQLVVTVPEPETYAMFLAGLGLMGAVARRRAKRG